MGLITANYKSGDFGVLTEERPSASLPFGGRYRLIDFPLSNMVNSGITTVGLLTPHMYRSLLDHVGVGKEWALSRKLGGLFILPGSVYGMRSGKAKILIRDLQLNKAFMERGDCDHIVICDASKIYNIDFSEVEKYHEESGNGITLLYKKGLFTDSGSEIYLDIVDNEVRGFKTEPNKEGNCFIDAIMLDTKLLFDLMDWYEDMSYMGLMEVITEHISDFRIGAYAFTGYVGPIYDLQSYLETSQDLLRGDVRKTLFREDRPVYTKVQDAPPAKYMTGCEVSGSLIASGCIIEGTVENSIIFRDVHIAKGAVVRNSVIMQHGEIGENARLEHVICDKNVTIRADVQISASYGRPMAINKKEQI